MPDRISASDYARITELPASSVRRWCTTGVLPAERVGRKIWMVDLVALEAKGTQKLALNAIWKHYNADMIADW